MQSRGSTEQRLKVLEDAVDSLLRENRQLKAREGRWRAPREFRIAKTVAEPPEEEGGDPEYPAAGANVYPIVFVDGTFTEEAGTQTATFDDRQDKPRHYVMDLDGSTYLEEGTKIIVVKANDRWWTARALGVQIKYGECNGNIDEGSTGTVSLLDPSDDSPTGEPDVTGVRNVYCDLLDEAKCHIVLLDSTWMLIAGKV